MPSRILCVDDEPGVLRGLKRRLGREFDVAIAESGQDALALMRGDGGFQVIVSDMRMPGMSGAELLSQASQEFPDTVRILLTGHSDLNDAIAAVNQGNIFRFLSKPCPAEDLMLALNAAVEHFRLIQAERELLEGTVRGSVTLLTEVLAMNDPVASSRGTRLKQHVSRLAAILQIEDGWDLEVAAMLSQIGFAVVPAEIVDRARKGEALTEQERRLYDSHASLARELLANIPRLETVADIVGALGGDKSAMTSPRVTLGVNLIGAAMDFDAYVQGGMSEGAAVAAMRANTRVPDDEILKALDQLAVEAGGYIEKEIDVGQLAPGMTLAADLCASDGRLLLTAGSQVSLAMRSRIAQYADHIGVQEPITVRVPS